MKKLISILFALLTFTAAAQERGLKDAYKDYFKMGVAINVRNLSTEAQKELILENFNSITCENEMKPISVHPAEGVWTWEGADSIANFCRHHGIKMRGHNLCWHAQFCDWMFTDKKGREVSKKVFYKRLRKHIHTVVNRYKDVVYCWDVVNEAMSDGGPNPYRESRAYKLCGDEFIAKAFQYAHEADPNALLFYNDYNAFQKRKCQNICDMVRKMKDAGVPIDGIGMQGHYNIFGPDAQEVDDAIAMYSQIVDHIQMTELDVRANEEMGGQLKFSRQGVNINDTIMAMQSDQYDKLFRVLRKHKDVVDCVTFWNLCDKDSWLGAGNYPLLFDANLKPKKCYYKVRDF